MRLSFPQLRIRSKHFKHSVIAAAIVIILATLIVVSSNSAKTDFSTLPFYGRVGKSAELKDTDAVFVAGMVKEFGNRESAAKEVLDRGWSFFEIKDLKNAMRRFNQAWLLDPENPNVYWGLGATVGANGNYDRAIEIFLIGLGIRHDHPMLMCNMAYAYIYRSGPIPHDHDLEIALKFLENANEIDPNLEYCHATWSIASFYEHNYQDAWYHVQYSMRLGGQSLDPRLVEAIKERAKSPFEVR